MQQRHKELGIKDLKTGWALCFTEPILAKQVAYAIRAATYEEDNVARSPDGASQERIYPPLRVPLGLPWREQSIFLAASAFHLDLYT